MILEPKETKTGKSLYNRKLENELNKFIIQNDVRGMGYEYMDSPDCRLIFITGKDRAEQDLPIFQYPYLIESVTNDKYLFTDLRPFVKQQETDYLNNIVKDRSGFELTINMTLFTRLLMLDQDTFDVVKKNLIIGYSKWVSKILLNAFRLDPNEELQVGIISMHYFLRTLEKDSEYNSIVTNIFGAMRGSGNIVNNFKYIENTLSRVNKEPESLLDFIDNLSKVIESGKLQYLTPEILLSSLGKSWYGSNAIVIIGLAIEHPPTFIALMYGAITDKAYKRSILTNILLNNSKSIQTEKFSKLVRKIIEEQII